MDNYLELIKGRHSVRQYLDKPLDHTIIELLQKEITTCNQEGNLNMQLITNEPQAFNSFLAHYGKFTNVKNYLVIVGKKSPTLEERSGYYGQRIVLKAQQLGLNSCWVALTYKKIKGVFEIKDGEKLVIVIALGYGKTNGATRKTKSIEAVSNVIATSPTWFKTGVEAALLAPTAMNQQKFILELKGNTVIAKAKRGMYSRVDLGIVKYNFELAAGKENFNWG